jgi:hypothetical protein
MNKEIFYDWVIDEMLEVQLPTPDNFLKVKETLSRIGVASKKQQKLFQTAHILHKRGRYFIVHFKELFILDNKDSNISLSDIERRNAIANLLDDWGLLKVVKKPLVNMNAVLAQIKIVSYKDKCNWEFCPKYTIGQKK